MDLMRPVIVGAIAPDLEGVLEGPAYSPGLSEVTRGRAINKRLARKIYRIVDETAGAELTIYPVSLM